MLSPIIQLQKHWHTGIFTDPFIIMQNYKAIQVCNGHKTNYDGKLQSLEHVIQDLDSAMHNIQGIITVWPHNICVSY